MNPYEILGVSEGAGEKECTSAFRKKVSELHPDKFRSDPEKLRQKEQELKKINEAYQILKNNNFKFNRNYEAGGFQDFNFNTEFNEDIFDIFSHFGFNMGRENTSGSS